VFSLFILSSSLFFFLSFIISFLSFFFLNIYSILQSSVSNAFHLCFCTTSFCLLVPFSCTQTQSVICLPTEYYALHVNSTLPRWKPVSCRSFVEVYLTHETAYWSFLRELSSFCKQRKKQTQNVLSIACCLAWQKRSSQAVKKS
jgi:hypothetical protein